MRPSRTCFLRNHGSGASALLRSSSVWYCGVSYLGALSRRTSFFQSSVSDQWKSSLATDPGSFIVLNASSAFARMSRCNSGSWGFPVVWPNGKSRNAVRGGFTAMMTSRALAMHIVGMPACSIRRAISPTDWWHTGQTGTSKTRSACSARSLSARSGANPSRTFREEYIPPMNVKA